MTGISMTASSRKTPSSLKNFKAVWASNKQASFRASGRQNGISPAGPAFGGETPSAANSIAAAMPSGYFSRMTRGF
jgi:hypothetical protein